MASKVAVVAAVVLLVKITGVLPPSTAQVGQRRPIPPGLARVMADGAGRVVAGSEGQSDCEWARDFVRRHGRERAIEIARLKHSDAEIEAWRRACFPASVPIAPGPGR